MNFQIFCSSLFRFHTRLIVLRMRMVAWYTTNRWAFSHWVFSWKQDTDGDLPFVICNKLAFIKYKESTIIHWNDKTLTQALKYQGSRGHMEN